ncbi:MAG TPA: hypothetical protein VIU93_03290 [Gallionellaceae bacterium]
MSLMNDTTPGQTGRWLRGLLLAACCCLSGSLHAAPDEIQVYTEEMDETGEFGLEMHVNYVIDGARESAYEGQSPTHHMLQTTPEFSYGISPNWEAGMYLPVAREEGGRVYGNGLRLRMKYMASRAADEKMFWGLNTEYGYSNLRVAESEWGAEIRPIIGYRSEDWLLSFNPILTFDLSGDFSRKPHFEPALKVTHSVSAGVQAGLEYYGEYGFVHDLLPAPERVNYLFAVLDVALHDYDFNLGLGRGDSNATDTWIAKAIIAFPFK